MRSLPQLTRRGHSSAPDRARLIQALWHRPDGVANARRTTRQRAVRSHSESRAARLPSRDPVPVAVARTSAPRHPYPLDARVPSVFVTRAGLMLPTVTARTPRQVVYRKWIRDTPDARVRGSVTAPVARFPARSGIQEW